MSAVEDRNWQEIDEPEIYGKKASIETKSMRPSEACCPAICAIRRGPPNSLRSRLPENELENSIVGRDKISRRVESAPAPIAQLAKCRRIPG